jgi:hypothetical protein
LRGEAHVVTASDEAAVPVGAVLQGCDGTGAARLAEQRIGRFEGRWMLRSRRAAQSGQLFLPPENPWLPALRACTFLADGRVRQLRLSWRSIEATKRTELLAGAVGKRFTTTVGLEQIADGTRWFNLGSFDSDPASPRGAELSALTAQVQREAEAIRAAPRLVFDLRGNNGGSSSWIGTMATAIWGKGAADRAVPDSVVDWRASAANHRTLQGHVERYARTREQNPASYAWAMRMEQGLAGARAEGQALWRQMPGPPTPSDADAPRVPAKVFVLTDHGCGSACLDAVDLLTGLGAIHVGQETAADTLYMETRGEPLPSGARIWIPMKVYRGRKRGSNVPAVPAHAWRGDIGDTEGLRKWIGAL